MPLKEALRFLWNPKMAFTKGGEALIDWGYWIKRKEIKDDNTRGKCWGSTEKESSPGRIIFPEKFQLIFSSWNKRAIKPFPLSFPFNSTEFPGKERACQASEKKGGSGIFCPALLLVSEYWLVQVTFWSEKSLAGRGVIPSIHPACQF